MRKRGFTLVEITVALAVLLVVLAIALPNFMKMYMVANEEAVAEAMRAVLQACEDFQVNTARGFPDSLAQLTNANPPYLSDRFRQVALGTWQGYQWTYWNPPGPAVGAADVFILTANPVQRGITGQRGFFADERGEIRFNVYGRASRNDPPLEQTG